MRALRLWAGADAYAVPMHAAREVVAAPTLTTLPTAPASVLGVCNVRGEIIPVFDTGILLGLGALPSCAAVAVVETPLGPAGLASSAIADSVDIGDRVGDTEGVATLGAFAVDNGLVVLLDTDALVSPARIAS